MKNRTVIATDFVRKLASIKVTTHDNKEGYVLQVSGDDTVASLRPMLVDAGIGGTLATAGIIRYKKKPLSAGHSFADLGIPDAATFTLVKSKPASGRNAGDVD